MTIANLGAIPAMYFAGPPFPGAISPQEVEVADKLMLDRLAGDVQNIALTAVTLRPGAVGSNTVF